MYMRHGFLSLLSLLLLSLTSSLYAAQTLNNPIGADGCYIVRWDCERNAFAAANDFEADETFTFAIDLTSTEWVEWLQQQGSTGTRGIATNFSTNHGDIARGADRLFHIQGNIYGKTINLAQLAESPLNPAQGEQLLIYSNLFGFEYTADNPATAWWLNPSEYITPDGTCFFRTAPYTGTHTCPGLTANAYDGNIYPLINQTGYAAPCVETFPCYGGSTLPDQPDTPSTPDTLPAIVPPIEGSHVYLFATDSLARGYYNRPYERYEAEPERCLTNGTFLAPSDDQRTLQAEASHQQALQLTAKGDYVAWVVNRAGDGLTIRFSLPDSEQGTGTKGNLAVYAGEEQVGTLALDSYWAWQYCTGNYPDNTPKTNCIIRMKFDETHLRLTRPVESGETLRLVKTDDNTTPYTIDFVELEPVPAPVRYEDITGDKVQYDGSSLLDFINANAGKTIYIPEGRWETDKRLYINRDNTAIIGAGEWYTEIYFSAPSNNASTYSQRGIETNRSNIRLEGLYLNTANNCRYYNNDDSKQVGKALMGSWGSNSVIRHCWAEHFECGGWIADYSSTGSNNLLVEHCRFRNNYADGINCSHASNGHTIRYCSFRNNGDDDMASWTTSRMCSHITFEYCTAENNWRASSLGFFGGTGHTAHHLAIFDPLESGARANADFSGRGFSSTEYISMHDITIVHAGCTSGTKGTAGDFWGNTQGAFNIGGTSNYAVRNIRIADIDIIDSRRFAFFFAGGSNGIENISLSDITIRNAGTGFYFGGIRGNATYCNLQFFDVDKPMNTYSSAWQWTEADDCATPITPAVIRPTQTARCYDLLGRTVEQPASGIYIVADGDRTYKIALP